MKEEHRFNQMNEVNEVGADGEVLIRKASKKQLDLENEMKQIAVVQQSKELSVESRIRSEMKQNMSHPSDRDIR